MPTRYLKQGICDSDVINALSDSAECLFYRLLVTVDDFGRADGRTLVIKSRCYPVKESVTPKLIEKLLDELETHGVIVRYVVDGKPYLQLQKWDLKSRSSVSKFPAPAYIYVQQNTDAEQLHTDVNHLHTEPEQPRTVLPEIVNEIEIDICAQTSDDAAQKNPQTQGVEKSASPKFDALRWLLDAGVAESHARDWLKVRKAKRAANTETAFETARNAATSAGWTMAQAVEHMAAKSWQGFNAEWVKGGKPPNPADVLSGDVVTMDNGVTLNRDFLRSIGVAQ